MEDNTKNKTRGSSFLMPLIGLVLIFLAIVIFILFLLNGETTFTGEFEGQKSIESLVCESKKVAYSIFQYDNTNDKNLKVNASFSNNKLESISLTYKLGYTDVEEISFSEARNHSAMNQSFNKDGMGPDSLEAKYGVLKDGLQLTIYASNKDINNKTLKYFMLDKAGDVNGLTKEKMSKAYNDLGLNCEIKEQSK